jgi:membrane fusion protein (multidrug efflux system)
MPLSRKKLSLCVVALGLALAGVYYVSHDAPHVEVVGGGRVQTRSPVEVARVSAVPSSHSLSSIGTLSSDESVKLASEIAGRVASFSFQEGQNVKAGEVLVRLDDGLLLAEVEDTEARLKLAEANFKRANTLQQSGSGTTRARDEAVSEREIARAALSLAQVRLGKSVLRAPFDGVAGLREASVGAFIQPGTALVNIEKIDTLKVDFRVPEINLADIKPAMKVIVRVDAFPAQSFEGEIYAIDPLLDVNGRSLRVRAKLANTNMLLRPGLFARIDVPLPAKGNVVTVPESTIVARSGGTVVFRVQGNKAEEVSVRLGRRTAAEVEIVEGLKEGDVVVTSGQLRLRPDAAVEIVGGDVHD